MINIFTVVVNLFLLLSAAQITEFVKMRYMRRGKKCAVRTGIGLTMVLFTGAAAANTFLSSVSVMVP